MSVTIPPGYGSAAWVFNGPFGTGPFVFTLGCDLSDAGGDFVEVANTARSAFTSTFGAELSDGLTLQKVSLIVGQDADGDYSVDSDLPPFPGERGSANDPLALSLLVNKNTARPGRQGRGRMNIPGVLEGDDTGLGGDLTPEAITKFSDLLEDFQSALAAGSGGVSAIFTPVLLHSDNDAPTPITTLVLAPLVGVLRKRLR